MTFDTKLFSGIVVFAAVVDAGKFALAATALGMTGSGVSRAISRLEQRVGVRLLERSPRAVGLTEEGRRFYARIKPTLEEAEAAALELGASQGALAGKLRIVAEAPAARSVMAGMLPAFCLAHPLLSVELVVRDSMSDLVGDGFDAAVRFGATDAVGLRRTPLASTAVVTVAAPALFDRVARPLAPDDLVHTPCILMKDPLTAAPYPWLYLKDGKQMQLRPRGGLLVNDGTTLIAACMAGAGVAQVLAVEARDAILAGTLTVLFADYDPEYYPLALYTRAGPITSGRVRAFTDALARHCAALVQAGVLHVAR
jgi:DNA-binding transcriptional LysR family regulator